MEEVKNIEVIDGILIDWSKFKNKATGKNLEKSRQSYIDFCKLLYNKNHVLLSDYNSVNKIVFIDIKCGHKPIEITPAYYKIKVGDIECPECTKIKMEETCSLYVTIEEPKYNKDIYTIGFYNENIDDIVKLNYCNRIFNNIKGLSYHVRNNDIIILASEFSLFGIDSKEILRIKDTYNLKFKIYGEDVDLDLMLKMNDYINRNKNTISKVINNI